MNSPRPRNALRRAALALACAVALPWSATAHAQAYPAKPIRMIVPLAAGSAVDVAARLLAAKMSQNMGQTVVQHLEVGHGVARHRVAVGPAAGGQRRVDGQGQGRGLRTLAGGQQGGRAGAAGTGAVPVGPQRMPPVGDLPGGVHPGLQPHQLRGAQGAVGQLVFTRPQHAHRPAGAVQRHQHRVQRHVVGAVVAVAAGTFDVVKCDGLLGYRHRFLRQR